VRSPFPATLPASGIPVHREDDMQQADDFVAEAEALHGVLALLDAAGPPAATPVPGTRFAARRCAHPRNA
jgi:hypothetical protein